jgi:hypothetical protein
VTSSFPGARRPSQNYRQRPGKSRGQPHSPQEQLSAKTQLSVNQPQRQSGARNTTSLMPNRFTVSPLALPALITYSGVGRRL